MRLATRHVQLANDAGALTVLPIAATYRAGGACPRRRVRAAEALINQADAIADAAGIATLRYTSLVLVAWRGREAEALKLIDASVQDATARGEGRAIALAAYATAVLYNGLGRYEAALAAAQQACEHDDLGLYGWALIELVEAGARSGAHDVAAAALRLLEERTHAAGTDWALGIEARSRALLSDGPTADSLYREAIERLERTRIAVHLARAHLVYGEWLRRENRRLDAREQLRVAYEMLSHDRAPRRSPSVPVASCWRPARRCASARSRRATCSPRRSRRSPASRLRGSTNAEIGAQLFISPANRRVPPAQGVHEARDQLPPRAPECNAGPLRRRDVASKPRERPTRRRATRTMLRPRRPGSAVGVGSWSSGLDEVEQISVELLGVRREEAV